MYGGLSASLASLAPSVSADKASLRTPELFCALSFDVVQGINECLPLNLRRLRYFVAVAEELSFRRAAERLHIIHLSIAPDLVPPLEHRFQSQPLLTCPMVAVLPTEHGFADDSASKIGVEALADQILLCPFPETSPGYAQRLAQLCAGKEPTHASRSN